MGDIQDILSAAGSQLTDITHVTWDSDNVLLPYLNLGILEIINLKPEAYAQTKNLTLATGSKQSIGTTDITILDFICNMDSSGNSEEDPIDFITKEQLEMSIPDWITYSGLGTVDTVQFSIYDSRHPRDFYVFPRQLSSGRKIRVVVSSCPNWIATESEDFPLNDSYKPAAVDYVIFRALSEETTIPGALNKAQIFWNKFLQDLGLKTNSERQVEMKEMGIIKP